MRHRGDLDPSLLEPQVGAQYVMEYLFNLYGIAITHKNVIHIFM